MRQSHCLLNMGYERLVTFCTLRKHPKMQYRLQMNFFTCMGIRLALLPEEINIGAVVRKTEDDFNLVECFSCTTNRCVITPVCRLRGVLHEALAAYIAVLDQYSLQDLIGNKDELGAILFAKQV